MNGKSKCKILKDIRRQIAQDNDITYVTSECKFQGDCTGTCPKCEAELRYLEDELRKRQKAGKAIAVAGIAAALVVTASGCELDRPGSRVMGDMAATYGELTGDLAPTDETETTGMEISGAIIAPEASDGTA